MFSVLGAGCSPEAVEWEVEGRRRTAPHQGYPPPAGKEGVGVCVCMRGGSRKKEGGRRRSGRGRKRECKGGGKRERQCSRGGREIVKGR